MEEILSEIIGKEKEAEEIVAQARQQAQQIVREGDVEAAKLTEDAKKKAGEIFSSLVAEAEKRAKTEFDAGLEEVRNMKNQLFRTKGEELERLTAEITGMILSSALDE